MQKSSSSCTPAWPRPVDWPCNTSLFWYICSAFGSLTPASKYKQKSGNSDWDWFWMIDAQDWVVDYIVWWLKTNRKASCWVVKSSGIAWVSSDRCLYCRRYSITVLWQGFKTSLDTPASSRSRCNEQVFMHYWRVSWLPCPHGLVVYATFADAAWTLY